MNKFSCTILPLLFLAGFPSPFKAASVPVSTAPIVKAVQTKANAKGWDIQITNLRYLGPVVQGKYELYEAAGTWIAVTVTCTNTTGKKQRTIDAPVSSILAELMDTTGKTHNVDERELKYDADLLSKPYALNESRTEVWLFDVPEGTRASQLVLDSFDENGVRFQLW